MRIRLNDAGFVPDLIVALLRGDCLPVLVNATTVEVMHPYAVDNREAAIEMLFFLRAWNLMSGTQAVVVPQS